MSNLRAALARAPIFITPAEADILTSLALSAARRAPRVANLLLAELERATICSPEKLPPDVVTMNSRIDYLDESTGRRHAIHLVMPGEADSDAGRISILTPVGAGLIGVRAGDAIDWPDLAGRDHALRILGVSQPPHP